jgi:iron complex outermembrane receptor protein
MTLRDLRRAQLCLATSSIALALGGLTAFEARAQDTPASTGTGEVVTVTAQRRAQAIQDVPASVTAFTAGLRDDTGIITAQQQLNFTPGVTYNPGADRVTIRGIGRLTTNLGTDQGVAVYQDGFYIGSVGGAAGIGGSTLGIARVEILRGPQGTLYGRNSVGGAVNAISRRPDDELTFDARTSVNNYGGVRGEARVAGAIADGISASLLLNAVSQSEGYYKNTHGGPDEGGVERGWNAEFQLKGEFENFDAWIRYSTLDNTSRPRNNTGITRYGEPARGEGIPYVFYGLGVNDNPGVDDHRKFFTDRPTVLDYDNYHQVIGELVWHAEKFDVKYTGGYRTYDSLLDFDGNATANQDILFPYDCVTLLGQNAARILVPGTTPQQFKQDLSIIEDCDLSQPGTQRQYAHIHNDTRDDTTDNREEYSHEINITSTGDGPFQYILGAYLFHANQDQRLNIIAVDEPGNNIITVPGSNAPNPSADESVIYHYNSILETTSWALYGQVDYAFSDELKATIGLRYSRDKKKGYEENTYVYWLVTGIPALPDFDGPGPLTASPFIPYDLVGGYCIPGPQVEGVPPFYRLDPAYECPIARDLKGSYEAVSGTAGLEWTPNDDRLVYIKYSRGFKSGGFNLGWALQDPFVEDEFLDAFEAGWKETVNDTLQFNSAIFFYKYHDLQALNSKIQNSITLTELINLPEVETYGLELEATWEPIRNLRFLANYSYLHTEITDDGCDSTTGAGCLTDGSDPYAIQPGAKPAGPLIVGPTRDLQGQSLVGNSLAGAPKHKVALNATYTWNTKQGELITSVTWNYISKSYQQLFNVPIHLIEGGDSTDIRVTWHDSDSGVSVIGSVTNVFDQEVSNGFITLPPQNLSFQSLYLEPPRIFSLEVRYSY